MFQFTEEQIKRYARHIILPEVGGKGQEKLLGSRVLVIGAGGLGSPALFYLAAAGVGTIGIVDYDVVDFSNLQRQILQNPDVRVITYNTLVNKENITELIRDYDIVLDGTDNFPTRFLINDACYFAGKPLVSAAMLRFEGQCTVFDFRNRESSPCYRCLFPEPPPPGLVPSCQEAGILGSIGGTLIGKLLIMDALSMEFRKVKLRKDPGCPLCGENPKITELVEYDHSCEARF